MVVCMHVCVCLSSALRQGLARLVCARSLQCERQLSLHFCVCVSECCGWCGAEGDGVFRRVSVFAHVITFGTFASSITAKSAYC